MVPPADCPANVIVVLDPLQTEAKVAVADPPTVVAFTTTEVIVLGTAAQTPLETSA